MLKFALAFLLIAMLAGLLGFGGMTTGAAGIAQIVFFIFLGLFAAALIAMLLRKLPPPRL